MILIYLPRPINSHNTIMRKVGSRSSFLVVYFQKHWKCIQVKSLLTEPLYLLTLRLFDIFISNTTHRLLVVSTTSCRYRAQNNGRPERSKSVQNEELTAQTSNVASMLNGPIFWKYVKQFIQIIALLRPVSTSANLFVRTGTVACSSIEKKQSDWFSLILVAKKLILIQLPELTPRSPANARLQLEFRAASLSIAVYKSRFKWTANCNWT